MGGYLQTTEVANEHAHDCRRPVERFAFTVNDACTAIGIKRTSLYEMIKNDGGGGAEDRQPRGDPAL